VTRLTLRLFGPPRLELDGAPVETDRRKALALLAYLAVTKQSHSREALAALFWPDYDQSRACRALQIASQRRDLPMMLDSLTGIVAIRAHVGEAARAAELLAFILNHPASEYVTRAKARRLFDEVSVQLPPEALTEAEARGRASTLEIVVASVQVSGEGE
jgi:hypothetical protein